jgi:uncharacterized protein YbjT (DUF2867 family)
MTITVAGANRRLLRLTSALLGRGHRVRVVTRQTGSPTAEWLRGRGAEIWQGDFDDPDTLVTTARGADAFFAAGTAHRVGPAGERRHGVAAADAAEASGVAHFVYLSGSGAGADTGVPVFDAKGSVEEHIRSLALPYTIVAPVYFMENLFNLWNLPLLRAGAFPSPVGVRTPLQQVALDDVVAFTALVLERGPNEFSGQRIAIASTASSATEAAQVLSRVLGRQFGAQRLDAELLPHALVRLFDWLERVGDHVDIPALHARYGEVPWLSFEGWVERQDWDALAGPA